MAFVKGQSGNPCGTTREAQRVRVLAQSRCARAIDVLTKIMEEGETEKNRLAAANALLDRGIGRPVQSREEGEQELVSLEVVRALLSDLRELRGQSNAER